MWIIPFWVHKPHHLKHLCTMPIPRVFRLVIFTSYRSSWGRVRSGSQMETVGCMLTFWWTSCGSWVLSVGQLWSMKPWIAIGLLKYEIFKILLFPFWGSYFHSYGEYGVCVGGEGGCGGCHIVGCLVGCFSLKWGLEVLCSHMTPGAGILRKTSNSMTLMIKP